MSKENNSSPFLRKFWKFFIAFIIAIPVFFTLVSFGILGHMPDIQELENPKSALASDLISEDGVLLGQYYIQKRSNVPYSEINVSVYDALISTEDRRFYDHSGIDLRGLLRAVAGMGKDGGASTITQQLARNLFHEERPKHKITRVIQKFKEWVIAIQLERRYTKDEIIAMYLNTVQFSGSSYGIKSASNQFFAKKP
ncbi:MAG: transglycosylase domain-containing protein, partial [Bacteroidia bacterium]|nr:transglycosylase domain-containing protein [Bacteroidia bacterium]